MTLITHFRTTNYAVVASDSMELIIDYDNNKTEYHSNSGCKDETEGNSIITGQRE